MQAAPAYSKEKQHSDDLTGLVGLKVGSGRGLSRKRAVEHFNFLLEIPSGLAYQVIEKVRTQSFKTEQRSCTSSPFLKLTCYSIE